MARRKNTQAKMRKLEDPYEIWKSPSEEWELRVLKKWQIDDDKPHARWFVAVKSPFTFGSFEYGDEYVASIKAQYVKVEGAGRP